MVVGSDSVNVAFVGRNNKKSFYPFETLQMDKRLKLREVKRNLISSKNIYSKKAFFESCFPCCRTT